MLKRPIRFKDQGIICNTSSNDIQFVNTLRVRLSCVKSCELRVCVNKQLVRMFPLPLLSYCVLTHDSLPSDPPPASY